MLLSKALLDLAYLINEVRDGSATSTTGASPTTLTDSAVANLEADDWYNGGVLWFRSGNHANKTATITDYTGASGVYTFATPGAGVITSGDTYSACKGTFSRQTMVQAINRAFGSIGPVDQVYENASLVIVADAETVTLPSNVFNVKQVRLADNDASPFSYGDAITGWREVGGVLYFDTDSIPSAQGTTGNQIQLLYCTTHASVTLDADVIADAINPERLRWHAGYHAMYNRYLLGGRRKEDYDAVVYFDQQRIAKDKQFPLRNAQHTPTLARN